MLGRTGWREWGLAFTSPEMALLLMMAIIIGGLINIPVKRVVHERVVPTHPLAVFGLGGFWPRMRRESRQTIIAVNRGGCVVPAGLALYELLLIAIADSPTLWAVLVDGVVNIAVCYFLARPVQGVGILLPGLVPAAVAAVAAVLALIFAPGDAAAVAYVAGVGPLIGADLLHLREIEQSAVGVASIG